MIYQVGKKRSNVRTQVENEMILTPGKWFYCPTPLPSGISWASDPPPPHLPEISNYLRGGGLDIFCNLHTLFENIYSIAHTQ